MDTKDTKHSIEVCFSPALYGLHHNPESVVVVIDVLRATTAICTAFINGALEIIPVENAEKARVYKQQGFLVAAERDGNTLDFADFGNSPFNFTPEIVANKSIVYSTTNGTQAINMASGAHKVVVAAFLNLNAVCNLLAAEKRAVVLFCAGWKNRFNLEDSLLAGAIAKNLLASGTFETQCDSAHAAMDLWTLAQSNVLEYVEKAAQRHRLRAKKLDNVLEYCFSIDVTEMVPVVTGNKLII